MADLGAEVDGYYDVECQDVKRCFNCHIAKSPVFSLRGPCVIKDNIDTKYIFRFDQMYTGRYIFQGFSGLTDIYATSGMNTWHLIYNNIINSTTEVLASLRNPGRVPIGTFHWNFTNLCQSELKEPLNSIKLTKVTFKNYLLIKAAQKKIDFPVHLSL
jgi:hypothetical protein